MKVKSFNNHIKNYVDIKVTRSLPLTIININYHKILSDFYSYYY